MNSPVYKTIDATTLKLLREELKRLEKEGWMPDGEPVPVSKVIGRKKKKVWTQPISQGVYAYRPD